MTLDTIFLSKTKPSILFLEHCWDHHLAAPVARSLLHHDCFITIFFTAVAFIEVMISCWDTRTLTLLLSHHDKTASFSLHRNWDHWSIRSISIAAMITALYSTSRLNHIRSECCGNQWDCMSLHIGLPRVSAIIETHWDSIDHLYVTLTTTIHCVEAATGIS